MTVKELNKSKVPIVKISNKLNKLATKVLFPSKVKEANHVLKTIGLPKVITRPAHRTSVVNSYSEFNKMNRVHARRTS